MALTDKDRRIATIILTDPDAAKEICDAYDVAAANGLDRFMFIPFADLDAGESVSAILTAFDVAISLQNIRLIAQGAFAGVDNSNPITFTVYDSTENVIAAKTYNGTTPPTDNGANDLGSLSNNNLEANQSITLAVESGTTANPPAFGILIRYRPR